MKNLGYYKLFTISPRVYIGNVSKNVEEHINQINQIKLKTNNANSIILFPELSLTGYSCEDLFLTDSLINSAFKGLESIRDFSKSLNQLLIVGLPYQHKGRLFNCSAVVWKGSIKAIVPKTFIPNYKEFYEKRYFIEPKEINEKIKIEKDEVHFGTSILIKAGELVLGVEICEDLWSVNPPNTKLALGGAHLIVNLSASNETICKDEFRRELVKSTSSRIVGGYLYCSAGIWESSKDLVFSGHCLYAEDGSIMAESDRFSFDSQIMETEIDIQKINHERRKNVTFGANQYERLEMIDIPFEETIDIQRKIEANPFVPTNKDNLKLRTEQILKMQACGLARRILSINKNTKLVLGLSGGMDSTLALLVSVEACRLLKKPLTDIYTLSLPGLGTSDRTKQNSNLLANAFGTSFLEIDISQSCKIHLESLNHEEKDIVFENTQARERTQTLLDFANKVNGIMVGSSTLSESFVGFCTYGGDQIANYNVNSSIPKTLVRFLIQNYQACDKIRNVLDSILATPISPELLPTNSQGEISQKTESILGPYELIDFYIYYYLRNGFSDEKILFLANKAFNDKYSADFIQKTFKNAYNRYRKNQFKRSCMPPGLKIGISLSPRGDLRLPDEYEGEGNDRL